MSKIVYLSSHYSEDEQHSITSHIMWHRGALARLRHRYPEWVLFNYMAALENANESARERILAFECAIVANCDLVVMLDDHDEYSAGMMVEQAAAIAAGVPVVKYSEVMR